MYAFNWGTGWVSGVNPLTHVRRRRWVREALLQPLAIKGFGPVKQANLEKTKPEWDRLVSDLSKIA